MKTEVPLKISLVSSVKSALIDYIENGRPKSNSEYIFLKHMAPYTELSCDTMYRVISTAIYKAGISIKNRKRGSHVLRSSLATAMINNGMTYEHVRKILGHQEENAINHYASLEIERLRLCALEVSEPTGYFASFLEGKEAIHDA